MRRTILAALPTLLLTLACATAPAVPVARPSGTPVSPSGAGDAPTPPRLVVFIVIDQLRHDTLDRFAPLLAGGLARLRRESVSWSEARIGHAATLTAPGHATLATGADPARHGVVANDWYDRAEQDEVNCVEDESSPLLEPDGGFGSAGDGRSPRRLRADGLGDWLQARWPAAKVYGVGGKDRGAILLAGRRPRAAFWYDSESGRFVTSRYYTTREPGWLARFHQQDPVEALFGTLWEPLAADRAALRAAGVRQAEDGRFARRLPYPLGGMSPAIGESFYEAVYDSPFIDERVARFAAALVAAEGLGADEIPDLLAVSFSALDAIGHTYGPHSFEAADAVLRLDRALGDLFTRLDERLGEQGWAAVLASDHGAQPLPELASDGGRERRAAAADVACVQRAGRDAGGAVGLPTAFVWGFSLDHAALAEAAKRRAGEVDLAAVAADAARRLALCESVDAVYTAAQLTAGEAPSPFVRSYFDGRSGDLTVSYDEGFLRLRGRGTTHGSVWDYDRHVPWLLRWPGIAPRTLDAPVETVDVAPTVAALLGVAPTGPVDGVDRGAGLLP